MRGTHDPFHPARSIPALAHTVDRIDGHAGHSISSTAVATKIALNAATEGYRAGYAQSARDAMSAQEVAMQLGITVQAVSRNAQRNDLGRQISRSVRVYWPADVEAMRARLMPKP